MDPAILFLSPGQKTFALVFMIFNRVFSMQILMLTFCCRTIKTYLLLVSESNRAAIFQFKFFLLLNVLSFCLLSRWLQNWIFLATQKEYNCFESAIHLQSFAKILHLSTIYYQLQYLLVFSTLLSNQLGWFLFKSKSNPLNQLCFRFFQFAQ